MTTRETSASRLARVAAAVRSRPSAVAERDPPYFEAAVALVLRATREDDVELLFIKRAARDDDPWSGQIALPGGRHDPGDASLEATAVRETLEEVAIDLRTAGAIVGTLDELRPRTPVLPPVIVRPFVATLSSDATPEASLEVAELFWAPLGVILDPSSTRDTEILVRGLRTRRPAIHYHGHVIWGMTERIITNLRELLS
ncbi:MAG: NUDIX hydrolase [Gemmatimonadales bacterium]